MRESIGVVFTAASGRPYSITTGFDDNGDSRAADRPLGVGRNTEQGPAYVTLDLRWSRSFAFGPDKNGKSGKNGKAARFKLSVDAFNVINHVNQGNPVGNLSSPFFGTSISASSARRLQISGRIRF